MTALDDPLSAARALRPTIRDHRQETEAARRLAPQVVEALIETGLCRLALTTDLGGYEADPVVALKIYEELAWAEAAVAWIAWNAQLVCLSSRYLNEPVRVAMFGDTRRLFANSTRPSGKAVMVEDGFRVSGQWSLVSGCELADWIPVMCMVIEGSERRRLASGAPETRMTFIPKDQYTILDTWHVGGLRGTGSHDIVVDDVFVPLEHTYSFMDPDLLNRPLSRMPFLATMAAGCAAICLGISQAAMDALLELNASQVKAGSSRGLRDRPAVQAIVASSAAELDASRLLLHDALGDIWAACRQGSPVLETQRARVWAGAVHTVKTAKAVVTSLYEAAGTSALYVDSPIERAHRDIHAVAQHTVLAHVRLEDAGRVHLGLKPNDPLF